MCWIPGLAKAVTGDTLLTLGGRGSLVLGKRMGEMKGGQFSLLSSANASTMSKVPGHGLPEG